MTSRILGIAILLVALQATTAVTADQLSRYVTLNYHEQHHLRSFNANISLGSTLGYRSKKYEIVTVEDEVLAKLDIIIDKAKDVLDMSPEKLHLKVMLLASREEVGHIYKKKYGKSTDHIAYYSLSEDTIYISVADTNLQVLAHEIGHAIVDQYFQIRPPYKIHELLAQFAEHHISDN